MSVIDTHIHVGRYHNITYTVGDLAELWREGVTEAWGSSLSVPTVGMRFGNEEMLAACREDARVKGLVWVNPYDPDWRPIAVDCLDAGFIGIKLHPPLNAYLPTQEMLGGVFELAGERGVPVFCHADNLDLFSKWLDSYPTVQFVVYHLGGPDGIWLAHNHAQVWLELSFCDVRKIVMASKMVGADRLLFGTDGPFRMIKNPYIDMRDGVYKTYRARGFDILDEALGDSSDRADVLHGNAVRLLAMAKEGT